MTLSSLLGTLLDTVALSAGRVYLNRLPQPFTLPAITFQRINTSFYYAHDGDTGLTDSYWQIDCWAVSQPETETLLAQVKAVLDGWATVVALPQEWRDLTDPETDIYHAVLEVTLWYAA